jgi:hypothetical protein
MQVLPHCSIEDGNPVLPPQEAFEAGSAPRVVLAATHEGALRYCALEDLTAHAAGPGAA